MDNELLDIFTDRLQIGIPLIQEHVHSLKKNKTDATAKLFRIFHNYKASASYLKLDELHELVSTGENILCSLRSNEGEATEHDIKWLTTSVVQFDIWCKQLLAREALTPVNSSLFPTISILNEHQKTTDIMQGLNLLYADNSIKRSASMKAPLNHIFKTVQTTDSLDVLRTAVLNNTADIIILNLEEDSLEIATELLNIKPDLALITAIPNLRANQKSRLLLKGLTHPITSPIQSKDLKRQLHNIVTSHFSKVYTVVCHEKVYNFIQGLDPLSSSIKHIIELCDDPDSSIKELINTISQDSIVTANILHAASLPIYGVTQTSSVKQAIAAFGKKLIKAISLSDIACRLGSLNLDSYGIDENSFKRTSALRLALMDKWYSQIDDNALSILSASAVLGNLGSILIDQEIQAEGLLEKFKTYLPTDISKAEVSLLQTSTAFVTADVLEFWGLESDLVDAIRYSDSPLNSMSTKIRSLACANAIVYRMVTPYGKFCDDVPKDVISLLRQEGLDQKLLEKAIEELKSQL